KKTSTLGKGEVLPLDRSLLMGDFSVVLFRSDFMLVSEKNHVKTHKNQWVRTMSCSPKCLSGTTNRGHTVPLTSWEPIVAGSRLPSIHAAPGRAPHDPPDP